MSMITVVNVEIHEDISKLNVDSIYALPRCFPVGVGMASVVTIDEWISQA